MDEVFDTSWLEKYENKEKELINHSSFEKEVIHNIKINILYINIHNNINRSIITGIILYNSFLFIVSKFLLITNISLLLDHINFIFYK